MGFSADVLDIDRQEKISTKTTMKIPKMKPKANRTHPQATAPQAASSDVRSREDLLLFRNIWSVNERRYLVKGVARTVRRAWVGGVCRVMLR
jgi:hypothetical protein